jgi:hypothetical protein
MEVRYPDFWTPLRMDLHLWFERNAPSLGELYKGALNMTFLEVFPEAFPGRVRFVAHAVREIRNRLPDIIAGPKAGWRLDYKSRLDDIGNLWKRSGLPFDGSTPTRVSERDALPSNDDIPLPYPVFQEVANLVRDHERARETRSEAARRLFLAIDPNNCVSEAILRPRIENWLKTTEWFVERAHDRGQKDAEMGGDELKGRFESFELALSAMVREFFKTVEALHEILEQANS